jgi:hypothetical protein
LYLSYATFNLMFSPQIIYENFKSFNGNEFIAALT